MVNVLLVLNLGKQLSPKICFNFGAFGLYCESGVICRCCRDSEEINHVRWWRNVAHFLATMRIRSLNPICPHHPVNLTALIVQPVNIFELCHKRVYFSDCARTGSITVQRFDQDFCHFFAHGQISDGH